MAGNKHASRAFAAKKNKKKRFNKKTPKKGQPNAPNESKYQPESIQQFIEDAIKIAHERPVRNDIEKFLSEKQVAFASIFGCSMVFEGMVRLKPGLRYGKNLEDFVLGEKGFNEIE